MIRTTTAGVNQTSSNTTHQQTVINGKFNNSIQFRFSLSQQFIQLKSKIFFISLFLKLLNFLGFTFSACTTVRGKPSNKKPFLHSGLSKFLSIMLTTNSSDTNLPSSMTFFKVAPNSEPELISARNISPVDKWQTQYFSFNKGAWKEIKW